MKGTVDHNYIGEPDNLVSVKRGRHHTPILGGACIIISENPTFRLLRTSFFRNHNPHLFLVIRRQIQDRVPAELEGVHRFPLELSSSNLAMTACLQQFGLLMQRTP